MSNMAIVSLGGNKCRTMGLGVFVVGPVAKFQINGLWQVRHV